MSKNETLKEYIRKNYGQIAESGSSGSCCSGGCSCSGTTLVPAETSARLGYTGEELAELPAGANMGLGCGNPVALAALKVGETVLDLGCGGGLDCFLASKQVGPDGHVIGVDMTAEMISLARKNATEAGYDNVEFRLGEIEHLPVADNTVDVIISNCVLNLSTNKAQAYREIYRVLKPGGRLMISDIVATVPLPEQVRSDLQLFAGCVAGAEHVDNLRELMNQVGFTGIDLTPKDNSREIIQSWAPGSKLEEYVASFNITANKPS